MSSPTIDRPVDPDTMLETLNLAVGRLLAQMRQAPPSEKLILLKRLNGYRDDIEFIEALIARDKMAHSMCA